MHGFPLRELSSGGCMICCVVCGGGELHCLLAGTAAWTAAHTHELLRQSLLFCEGPVQTATAGSVFFGSVV